MELKHEGWPVGVTNVMPASIKTQDAPDALFGPMEGQDRAEGDFHGQSFSKSYSTWLDMHPAVKRGVVVGGVLAALTVLWTKLKAE